MDSFIDKFAQRKNAQEMIRANAMAEAEEKKKMAARLSEYELAMQEMRKCSLLNMENAEKVKEALAASLAKIEEVQKNGEASKESPEKTAEEVKALLKELTEQAAKMLEEQQNRTAEILERQSGRMEELSKEQSGRMEELSKEQQDRTTELLKEQTAELLETGKKEIKELLQASEDFNHKEAVKVYRNVQAVIDEALPKQTAEITEAIKNTEGKKGASVWMIVLGVLTFAAAAANVVIEVLRILGYL